MRIAIHLFKSISTLSTLPVVSFYFAELIHILLQSLVYALGVLRITVGMQSMNVVAVLLL